MELIEKYKIDRHTYLSFKDSLERLIDWLIRNAGLNIHQITARTKEINSLTKKIDSKGSKYSSLNDITDLVGVRIITYLESDVDAIAKLIEREFSKDYENSVDKRKLKSDQFGYRSLHLVLQLPENRSNLPEYSHFRDIKFEVQIRSILQHAWAEIEHDIGYKGNNIPEPAKRTFNRLAALLEIGDLEFDRLKAELTKYEVDVPNLVEKSPETVEINKASLSYLIDSNEILKKGIDILQSTTTTPLSFDKITDYDSLITVLKHDGFETIKDIETLLNTNSAEFFSFIERDAKMHGPNAGYHIHRIFHLLRNFKHKRHLVFRTIT